MDRFAVPGLMFDETISYVGNKIPSTVRGVTSSLSQAYAKPSTTKCVCVRAIKKPTCTYSPSLPLVIWVCSFRAHLGVLFEISLKNLPSVTAPPPARGPLLVVAVGPLLVGCRLWRVFGPVRVVVMPGPLPIIMAPLLGRPDVLPASAFLIVFAPFSVDSLPGIFSKLVPASAFSSLFFSVCWATSIFRFGECLGYLITPVWSLPTRSSFFL